jgi:hypothetical protein
VRRLYRDSAALSVPTLNNQKGKNMEIFTSFLKKEGFPEEAFS